MEAARVSRGGLAAVGCGAFCHVASVERARAGAGSCRVTGVGSADMTSTLGIPAMPELTHAMTSNVTEHTAGCWWWADLTTGDLAAAEAFYGSLFGWEFTRISAADGMGYSLATIGGLPVAALVEMQVEQETPAAPSRWTGYVTVDDVDASAALARDLGATLLLEPGDVGDAGRMALVRDAEGATFALWQARSHRGTMLREDHGTLCWMELMTRDPAQAIAFYTELLGLTSKPFGSVYTVLDNPRSGANSAGILQMGDDMASVPPSWGVYFNVDDADAAVAQVREAGGQVIVEPRPVSGIGRFAVCADPLGAVFMVMQGE